MTTGGTSCVMSGLTPGRTYVFTVAAVNDVGVSNASVPSVPIRLPSGVPNVPVVSGVARDGDGSVMVNVASATTDVNATGVSYRVVSSPGGRSCVVSAVGGKGQCRVVGLTNGVAYTFTVSATNMYGSSAMSAPSGTVVAGRVASRPVNVVAQSVGSRTLRVSWGLPSYDGGLAVSGYRVFAAGKQVCSTGGLSCDVSGLTVGGLYSFTVVAVNDAGVSTGSVGSALVRVK